jgi:hypothetical protein
MWWRRRLDSDRYGGIFEAPAGDAVNGERHEGLRAVRVAYEAVFARYPDAHWGHARHFVTGFTFRNGRIAVKNSFRKNRPPLEE